EGIARAADRADHGVAHGLHVLQLQDLHDRLHLAVEAELVRLFEIDGGVLAGQRQVDAVGLRLPDLGDVAREVLRAHGRIVAPDDSATPVRNFTPSFSTSFCALRTAVAGSPAVSSKMNSTGRPRIPLALTSLANRSAARLAWMPYWALLPDSAAGIPILIGPCAHI